MSNAGLLEDKVGHPSPARGRIGWIRLFSPLFLGPILFTGQIAANFTIADSACTRNKLPAAPLVIFNLVCLAFLVSMVVLSVANSRIVKGEAPQVNELRNTGNGRSAFLVQFGLTMTSLFAIGSLVELVAIFFLGACPGYPPTL